MFFYCCNNLIPIKLLKINIKIKQLVQDLLINSFPLFPAHFLLLLLCQRILKII